MCANDECGGVSGDVVDLSGAEGFNAAQRADLGLGGGEKEELPRGRGRVGDGEGAAAVAGGEVGGDGVDEALAALVVTPGALQLRVVGELGASEPVQRGDLGCGDGADEPFGGVGQISEGIPGVGDQVGSVEGLVAWACSTTARKSCCSSPKCP